MLALISVMTLNCRIHSCNDDDDDDDDIFIYFLLRSVYLWCLSPTRRRSMAILSPLTIGHAMSN